MRKLVMAVVNWGEALFVRLAGLLFKMPAGTAVQAYRFLFSGTISAACYSLAAVLLVELGGWPPIPAIAAAFVVGTLVSYMLNALWSFQTKMTGTLMMKFFVITLIGFALNQAITYLITAVLDWHYGIALFVTLVLVPIFNFLGHKLWTFRNAPTAA